MHTTLHSYKNSFLLLCYYVTVVVRGVLIDDALRNQQMSGGYMYSNQYISLLMREMLKNDKIGEKEYEPK